MNATDIMTPDVIYAAPDTPLRDLVRLMLDNHVSALPIVEYGRIVGIVTEGDLFRRVELGAEPRPSAWQALLRSTDRLAADYTRSHGQKASELMTRNVVTVSDTMLLEEVALLLDTKHVKRVPVIRDGKLVGIVSRRNLLQALASRLTAPSVTAEDRSIREAFYQTLHEQPWAAGIRAINAMVADGVVHLWVRRRTTRCARRSSWWRRTWRASARWRTIWTAQAWSIRSICRTGPPRRRRDQRRAILLAVAKRAGAGLGHRRRHPVALI